MEENVSRFPTRKVQGIPLRVKKSSISLKESAFFEYRWYKILEALYNTDDVMTLGNLIRSLKRMGVNANDRVIKDDLLRLEEQEYVESYWDSQFHQGKRFRLRPKGVQKVQRVLRKL